jgi:hypothetical protein
MSAPSEPRERWLSRASGRNSDRASAAASRWVRTVVGAEELVHQARRTRARPASRSRARPAAKPASRAWRVRTISATCATGGDDRLHQHVAVDRPDAPAAAIVREERVGRPAVARSSSQRPRLAVVADEARRRDGGVGQLGQADAQHAVGRGELGLERQPADQPVDRRRPARPGDRTAEPRRGRSARRPARGRAQRPAPDGARRPARPRRPARDGAWHDRRRPGPRRRGHPRRLRARDRDRPLDPGRRRQRPRAGVADRAARRRDDHRAGARRQLGRVRRAARGARRGLGRGRDRGAGGVAARRPQRGRALDLDRTSGRGLVAGVGRPGADRQVGIGAIVVEVALEVSEVLGRQRRRRQRSAHPRGGRGGGRGTATDDMALREAHACGLCNQLASPPARLSAANLGARGRALGGARGGCCPRSTRGARGPQGPSRT